MSEYKVGDKFVVEIAEVHDEPFNEVDLYRMKGFNSLVFDKNGLDKLQKYDAEINKENYYDAGYNAGLQDAWELNQKLFVGVSEGGWSGKKIKDIFGMVGYEVITEMTPREALDKLEAYEKEQVEIKVGDVVESIWNGMKCVVSSDKGCTGYVLTFPDGSSLTEDLTFIKQNYKKTGKHIDIQNILKQISED